MVVSGMAKSLLQNYGASYSIKSGEDAYSGEKAQVQRKVPLLIMGSFGVGTFLILLGMSAIFKASNFRTALDVLSVLLGLNAAGFLTHAIRVKWGRKA